MMVSDYYPTSTEKLVYHPVPAQRTILLVRLVAKSAPSLVEPNG